MRFRITAQGHPRPEYTPVPLPASVTPTASLKLRGLGDLVAVVANPLKQAIMRHGPRMMRDWLQHCRCSERQEAWNKAVPFA